MYMKIVPEFFVISTQENLKQLGSKRKTRNDTKKTTIWLTRRYKRCKTRQDSQKVKEEVGADLQGDRDTNKEEIVRTVNPEVVCNNEKCISFYLTEDGIVK